MTLPWFSIHDFLLSCGSIRTPEEFGSHILNTVGKLIPFDQGRMYFLDGNGNVQREYLLGVTKREAREYHDYYAQVDGGRFSTAMFARWFSLHYPSVDECIFTPESYGASLFYTEYVKASNIRHSFGMPLRDTEHSMKCMFSLDRTCDVPYSPEEREIMKIIRSHLDNLFQNLYVAPPKPTASSEEIYETLPLTRREKEVTDLLLQGVTPQNISRKLCISPTTVKKHMDHIYKKLHVNTRQELLLKLMNH